MQIRSERDGFALPTTILLIGLITAGVLAAFSRVDVESQVVMNGNAQVDAFALAQAGLEQAIAARANTPDSATYALHGGTATVRIRQLRPAVGATPPLYVITSRGVPTRPAAHAPAQHTVSQFAYWREGTMQVRSAWTSLGGLIKNGGSGTLSGVDKCGQKPTVAGVSVPTGMYDQQGGGSVPDGNPGIEEMGTKAEMGDSVRIDWNGIINHNAIVADLTIPPDSWPSFNDTNYWPVIRIANGATGEFTLPGNGRGTLIVEGNFTISGGVEWHGILLVGGRLVSDGNNTVYGATISGLNEKLGMTVGVSDIGNGTKTFQYDSCAISRAASRYAALLAVRNAWGDSWIGL
jgi:hypothetical protein